MLSKIEIVEAMEQVINDIYMPAIRDEVARVLTPEVIAKAVDEQMAYLLRTRYSVVLSLKENSCSD